LADCTWQFCDGQQCQVGEQPAQWRQWLLRLRDSLPMGWVWLKRCTLQ
jgi:hypothetical protein